MATRDDEFYDELSRLNNELTNMQRDLAKKNVALEQALARVKRLEGILPICMHCHSIRSDDESWQKLEEYLETYTDVVLSHGLCDKCLEEHYPKYKEGEDDDFSMLKEL